MKPQSTLVSVIIPAYNHEHFVGRAIDSVLQQTHENLELVVVDDGSTDQTLEVIRGFSDPRIRSFSQANQDAFNALNRCMDESTGEYLTILNSDDVYLPNRIAEILGELASTGGLCAFTGLVPIDAQDRELAAPHAWLDWYESLGRAYDRSGSLYEAFLSGNLMVTSSNLFFHKKVSQKVGRFSSLRYLHDYDYMFRILQEFEAETIFMRQSQLLRYRVHDGNTIAKAAFAGRVENTALVRKYLYDRFPVQFHGYFDAGIDRLLQLQRELIELGMSSRSPAAPPALHLKP